MLLFDPATTLGALLIALALDALIGDPRWLYRRIPHPVVLIGRASARLEAAWLDESAPPEALRRRGRKATLLIAGASLVPGALIHAASGDLGLGWLLLGLLMSSLIAFRGLHDHVFQVADALDEDVDEGRRAVAHIVGRDPESLDGHGVARAAIESCAENFADGVVAPLFWGALLGLPGLLAYKAINTLDSSIGHRSARYVHFGRFAARLDDAVNWAPARLAAGLLLAVALVQPGCDARSGWRALRQDAPRHRSPNAGWPEAAMAGALGLRLAGPRSYAGRVVDDAWMGNGRAAATSDDIRRALELLRSATRLTGALLLLGLGVALAG